MMNQVYNVIQIRQSILEICKDGSYKEVYDKTVSPQRTLDKYITVMDDLKKHTKDIPLVLKEIVPFEMFIFGKTLEKGKKVVDYVNMKMKKTVVKPVLSEDTLKQFNVQPMVEAVEKVRFFEDRPNKKQKLDMEVIEGVVKDEELENIGKSRIIREKLLNPKMQHLILDIDQAPDRVAALRNAMKDPEFDLFASELMYLVGERSKEDLFSDIEHIQSRIKTQE